MKSDEPINDLAAAIEQELREPELTNRYAVLVRKGKYAIIRHVIGNDRWDSTGMVFDIFSEARFYAELLEDGTRWRERSEREKDQARLNELVERDSLGFSNTGLPVPGKIRTEPEDPA